LKTCIYLWQKIIRPELDLSLFALEKSRINFKEIRSFCDQQISEGLRIEYKRSFPENVDLAKTICAFANTAGGIILIGVEADKKKNTPTNIPGIQITEGLEEKVVNICLSYILPRIMPEIKLCPFKSNDETERAVLFIRVGLSYSSPHYVWQTREILVRVHNENGRADLKTIEDLIDRRKRIISESGTTAYSTHWSTKLITIEEPVFETAVIHLHFAKENIVPFSKENDAVLFEIANQIPYPNYLMLESRNSQGQITRMCRVDGYGRLIFQRTANVRKNVLDAFESFIFLASVLRATRKICLHFAFYGDVSAGLTITNTKNLSLGFPQWKRYLLDDHKCEFETISVSRTLHYDDFSNLSQPIESMFADFCRFFHYEPDSTLTTKIVEQYFLPSLK
jgi:hypothetical protein